MISLCKKFDLFLLLVMTCDWYKVHDLIRDSYVDNERWILLFTYFKMETRGKCLLSSFWTSLIHSTGFQFSLE